MDSLYKRVEWNKREIAKNQESEDFDPTYDNWLGQKIVHIVAAVNELLSVSPARGVGDSRAE